VGDFETATLVVEESSVRYHSFYVAALTPRIGGQCVLGSLPGAGAS